MRASAIMPSLMDFLLSKHIINDNIHETANESGIRGNGAMFISHVTRNAVMERIRRLFGAPPCRLQAAALPWRHGESGSLEVLLVTSRGTGRWVLPKGWPEGAEELFDAAAREASEEAGVAGMVSSSQLGRYYYGKVLANGLEKRCEVPVFPLEVTQISEKWPERKERKRRWFSPAEAARIVDEPDLAELIVGFNAHPRKIAA